MTQNAGDSEGVDDTQTHILPHISSQSESSVSTGGSEAAGAQWGERQLARVG